MGKSVNESEVGDMPGGEGVAVAESQSILIRLFYFELFFHVPNDTNKNTNNYFCRMEVYPLTSS